MIGCAKAFAGTNNLLVYMDKKVVLKLKVIIKMLLLLILSGNVLVSVVFANEDITKTKWIRVNSKNFNVVSNAGEKETRELTSKLEQFRFVIASIFSVKDAKTVPITVYVFKDDQSFTPFKVRSQGRVANISGYFVNGVDEKLIALELTSGNLRAIFHEYTHLVSSLTKYKLPLWVAEGIADFYSSFEIKKNKEAVFGYGIKEYIYLLRNKPLIPIQELFKVDFESPYYTEKEKNNIFYAESWALVHYLSQGSRQKEYLQFVRAILNGIGVDEAFSAAFHTSYGVLEKELKDYISQNNSPVAIYNFSSIDFEKNSTVENLREIEVKHYLGKLLLPLGILVEAQQYFEDIIKQEPTNPLGYEGLGRLFIEKKHFSEAKESLEKAISLGASGGYVHYLYASSIYKEIVGDETYFVITDEEKLKKFLQVTETLSKELHYAIELSPSSYDEYYLLATIFLISEKNLGDGLALVKTARQLEPQNDSLVLLQAAVLAKMKDYSNAKQVLKSLLSERVEQDIKLRAEIMAENIDGVMGGLSSSVKTSNVSSTPQILSKPIPKYTAKAGEEKLEGVVILSATFGKDGNIRDIKVIKGLGSGLDEKAIEAAQNIKFNPAQKNGQLVDAKGRLEYVFSLLREFELEFWQKEIIVKPGESKKIGIKISRDKEIKGNVKISLTESIEGIEQVSKDFSTNEDDDVIEIKVSDSVKPGKYKLKFIAKVDGVEEQGVGELIVSVE